MKKFKKLLKEINACSDARKWAKDMTIEEVLEKCHRGDWLLWLAHKVDIGLQPLTLAKGYCAATALHLMKDERSKKAIEVAISFGLGNSTKEELAAAADAAYAAAYTASYADAYAAAYAAAAYAADAYADAYAAAAYAYAAAYTASYADAYAAAYAADAAADAYTAKSKNQLQTADICRQYIGQLIKKKINELLKI